MKIVICLPVSRYKINAWLLPASIPMDKPKDCAGIRSLHELAVAVAVTGRDVELRGEFDIDMLASLSEASGAIPTVNLEPRLPTADDIVIIPEGTPSALDFACASLSPAQYVIFMQDLPGLFGWFFKSGLNSPDSLVVNTSDVGTADSFNNISECGFSIWTNSSRLASACVEAGVSCTDIGIGYPRTTGHIPEKELDFVAAESPSQIIDSTDKLLADTKGLEELPSPAVASERQQTGWSDYVKRVDTAFMQYRQMDHINSARNQFGLEIRNHYDAIDTQLLRAEEEIEQAVYTMQILRKRAVSNISLRQFMNSVWHMSLPQSAVKLTSHIFPKLKRNFFILIGPGSFDDPNYLMRQALVYIGAEIHTVPDPKRVYDLVLGWHNSTGSRTPGMTSRSSEVKVALSIMVRTASARNYWNCSPGIDISKHLLERKFKIVFGRSLGINPEVYTGLAIEKSNENATHDGRIVQCPTPRVPDKTYQYFVDRPKDPLLQWRIVVMAGKPVIAIERLMERQNRFHHALQSRKVVITDIISAEEYSQISELCREMFIEYCEVDMLRDHNDLMWIVDINPTPVLSPLCVPDADERKLVVSSMAFLLQKLL